MTRDQFIEFLNQQADVLGLNIPALISVESASRMSFHDLTSDSLETLQLVMAIEEATGIDVEIDDLRNFTTLLDAIDFLVGCNVRSD